MLARPGKESSHQKMRQTSGSHWAEDPGTFQTTPPQEVVETMLTRPGKESSHQKVRETRGIHWEEDPWTWITCPNGKV